MDYRGYITLHRKIQDHWIMGRDDYFKAWVLVLMEVNHKTQNVLIEGTVLKCKRGESLKSLDTWAATFGKGWNKSKVRRFFELLKKDSMIVTKNERKTTRLTVCNYREYQPERNTDETQMKRSRHADDTQTTPNNNDKNEKNENNIYRAFAHLSLSNTEFNKLIEDGYTKERVDQLCDDIENYKKNTNYKSLNLTLRKWSKGDKGRSSIYNQSDIAKERDRKVMEKYGIQ